MKKMCRYLAVFRQYYL